MSVRQIHDVEAQVISLDKAPGNTYKVCLKAPQIAINAKPMQFVNVLIGESTDPLLRRPFSLSAIEPEDGLIEITWAVVGKGTKMMTEWTIGQKVNVLGPLGNGFDINTLSNRQCLVIVAGGTGLAPLIPLIRLAKERKMNIYLFYGASSANQLLDTTSLSKGCSIHFATEDGSLGYKGLVTNLLETHIGRIVEDRLAGQVTAISCGPRPMLNQVKAICIEHKVSLFVSIEGRMACGYGLCQGCVIKSSGSEQEYYHICTDGPVFKADDVDLGECVE